MVLIVTVPCHSFNLINLIMFLFISVNKGFVNLKRNIMLQGILKALLVSNSCCY